MMTINPRKLESYLANPNNFLYSMDLQKGSFEFVETTREELSDLAFLDTRTLGQKADKITIPAPEVISALQKMDFQKHLKPANYLFHTSFCCSTMLARCLDVPGKNLSLKEPFALLGLAAFKGSSANFDPNDPGWKNLRDITLSFLSRPFQDGEKTLMKPSNGANSILPELLEYPETKKVVILYGDLENFLISVLKGGAKRAVTVENTLYGLAKDFEGNLPGGAEQISALSKLQKSALLWGLQMRFFQKVPTTNRTDKVKSLKSKTFLDHPVATLTKLNDWYGLEFFQNNIHDIIAGPAFKTHSKDMQFAFSNSQQLKEKENILMIFKDEIEQTMVWANSIGLGFENGLENPL